MEHPPLVLHPGVVGEREVGAGDVDPVRLVLDTDGAAPGVQRFDERGADPAHRVEHQIARLGVVGDRVRRDGREHLRRVRGRLGRVAALALGRRGGLRGRPHRHRNVTRRVVDDPLRRRTCGAVEVVDERARDALGRPVHRVLDTGRGRVGAGVGQGGREAVVGHGRAFLAVVSGLGGVRHLGVGHRITPLSSAASAGLWRGGS